MDKQTTLGFILIGLVLIVWMWIQSPVPQHPRSVRDTAAAVPAEEPPKTVDSRDVSSGQIGTPDVLGRFFGHLKQGVEKVFVVRTDLYMAEITTRGGLLRKWELMDYKTWDAYPVGLVDFETGGDFSLLFTSSDGKLINTRELYFDSELPPWKTIELTGEETFSFTLKLRVDEGKQILKRLTFKNGTYALDVEYEFENMQTVISNFEYQVIWENALRYAERNSIDESDFAMAYAYSGGELIEVDAGGEPEGIKKDINGVTDWVAARNKYFALAILPVNQKSQGAYLEGLQTPQPDDGRKEKYSIALKMPYKGAAYEKARFDVFLGPLDIDIVRSYNRNLDQIMSLGAAWIIRPISEYIMLPLFSFLHMFIPNFGVVIIVFSIIIKVALYPLTKSSMKSMKKMQALQPMMNEIREKFKDDPQKMNQQIMNLYRDYGVNPAGGCLPLLLQMPILYALYMVFRSAIELRQAHFVWWINDLSVPDTIVELPFPIPIFGMSQVSGLAVAMGLTMFLQQKMTITDPRQKVMVWMMPLLLTLLFNGFPSGLNLYYFIFNLLSIGQQMWINKHHANEPLRKVDRSKKSGGVLGRITRDMPKMR